MFVVCGLLLQITGENEATILRLTEQAKVLKEEIRRLERNQARENAIANMEYLKNVVLKVSLDAFQKNTGLILFGYCIRHIFRESNFSRIGTLIFFKFIYLFPHMGWKSFQQSWFSKGSN